MTRKRFSARLPEKTHRQLVALAKKYGTKTQVVVAAVSELTRWEQMRQNQVPPFETSSSGTMPDDTEYKTWYGDGEKGQ